MNTLMRVALIACFAFVGAADASTDYVFSSSFEVIVCDGTDCNYCSPVDPQPACGSSSHCSPQPDMNSVCSYPAGVGLTGAVCSELADCAGPFACVNTGSPAASCHMWCQVGNIAACSGSQTCNAFATQLFTGGMEWGVCL